ncbi:hypothetical protein CCHR01_12986 [Colletotrichum chrysophilum]|uniref:Uncharacterized protein n=1 Tax=Colletotrichum chrysophilum TaxID=1836956 RepID=A0AAD9AAB1_9PEZI|nr:hypothetical protein CCHR01_12986 [Colletotrichum chrysophilum]
MFQLLRRDHPGSPSRNRPLGDPRHRQRPSLLLAPRASLSQPQPTTAQPHTPSSPITKPASQPPHVPSSHQETRQVPPEGGSARAKLRSTSWEFLGCLPISLGANASRPAALAPPSGRRGGQPGDERMEIRRASPDSGLAWRRFGGTPLTPKQAGHSPTYENMTDSFPQHHSSDVRHSAGDAGRRRRSADASHTAGAQRGQKTLLVIGTTFERTGRRGGDFIAVAGFSSSSFSLRLMG